MACVYYRKLAFTPGGKTLENKGKKSCPSRKNIPIFDGFIHNHLLYAEMGRRDNGSIKVLPFDWEL